ncbi:hypothetical protein KI387_036724, partial [Taxus chinensis]
MEQLGQRYANRPNRPKLSQRVQNQMGYPGQMDAKYVKDPASWRTNQKMPHVSKRKVKKSKGQGLKRWPESIGIGHVSNRAV